MADDVTVEEGKRGFGPSGRRSGERRGRERKNEEGREEGLALGWRGRREGRSGNLRRKKVCSGGGKGI